LVELNDGITILPELATLELATRQKKFIRQFRRPAPLREVSLVTHRDFLKKRMIDALKKEIIVSLPEKIRKNKNANVIPV
jgi:LysR family transcriptional regulator, hydrogen peroxide-inducible genes activator